MIAISSTAPAVRVFGIASRIAPSNSAPPTAK
jgi:hypothetical protein